MPYAQKFYFEEFGDVAPPGLREEFHRITDGLYPAEIIERMRKDGYDPFIIGNSHDFRWDFPGLVKIALGSDPPEGLKIALELMPKQLGWLSDFLRDAKEYREKGTIRGEAPSEETVGHLKAYPRKLSNTELGAIQCLEAGMEVLAIEHDDSRAWIDEDHRTPLVEESAWAEGPEWDDLQPGYTSIRRDRHCLEVIERERPAVILVGTYHALKYDLLLGRDGTRCHVYSTQRFRWDLTLRMWREAHELYRKHALRPA